METTSKAKILEGNVSADPELVRIYPPPGLLNYHTQISIPNGTASPNSKKHLKNLQPL